MLDNIPYVIYWLKQSGNTCKCGLEGGGYVPCGLCDIMYISPSQSDPNKRVCYFKPAVNHRQHWKKSSLLSFLLNTIRTICLNSLRCSQACVRIWYTDLNVTFVLPFSFFFLQYTYILSYCTLTYSC